MMKFMAIFAMVFSFLLLLTGVGNIGQKGSVASIVGGTVLLVLAAGLEVLRLCI